MNSLKIAWRSIQHRGLGSVLTILSMALGVMLVVAVLTVHGVVSQSFKSNSNFAYDVIIGPSGSSMQVTMNTVFYLSKPVENIPYEYYLAFCNSDRRREQLKHSVAWQTRLIREQVARANDQLLAASMPGIGLFGLASLTLQNGKNQVEDKRIGLNAAGSQSALAEMVIPINLGDYLGRFRVVGTSTDFFEAMLLDIDTGKKFTFADGRAFRDFDETNHYYEAVLGSKAAKEQGLKVGDVINPVHGDPNDEGSHTHDQGFTVVGILDSTGTPHDRAVFVNMEGFYLMDGHVKPVNERLMTEAAPVDDDENEESATGEQSKNPATVSTATKPVMPRLPIEQREVTALLIRSTNVEEEPEEDGTSFATIGSSFVISGNVNEGVLESELGWTDYRPLRAKTEVQAISPVAEVTSLFDNFVNPIRWILLVLTIMICVVSAISILVGIYSSMSQRRHEIAVIRALGASRGKVMLITLLESITLAVLGGMIGWVAGHTLNACASPLIESRTGVSIGFWDFAPGLPIFSYLGFSGVSWLGVDNLEWFRISTELFLIPGLILLAIIVGVYPAISAYRTDVAKSLG